MKIITFDADILAAQVQAEAKRLKVSYLTLEYSFCGNDYSESCSHGWRAYSTEGSFTEYHATPEAALSQAASMCGPDAIRAKAIALQKEARELLAQIGEGGAS